MSMLLKFRAKCDEWLDVATAADHLNDDVELDSKRFRVGIWGGYIFVRRRFEAFFVVLCWEALEVRKEKRERLDDARIEVDIEASIVWS